MSDVKFESHIPEFEKMLKEANEKALEEVAKFLEEEAKQLVPVDTGKLRESIGTEINDGELQLGANTDYALAIEKGTSKKRAQPYLTPAVERNTDRIASIIKEAIKVD